VAMDTPRALRDRMFPPRIRVTLRQPAASFVDVVRRAGFGSVNADDTVLSVSLDGRTPGTPDLVRRLVEAGADIEAVEPEERRLEDVYLKLLHADGSVQ